MTYRQLLETGTRILEESNIDEYDVDVAIIEGMSMEGLGLAIMNRLIRACNHNYVEI